MNRGREGGEERRRRGCVNGRTCEMEDSRSAANQILNRKENQRKTGRKLVGPRKQKCVDFIRQIQRKRTQTLRKLFGPRKRKCVDFSRQIQRKRQGIFDRFRMAGWMLGKVTHYCTVTVPTGWAGWAGWLGWLGWAG